MKLRGGRSIGEAAKGGMKLRIPKLREDDPARPMSGEERDQTLCLACRAAVRLLDDQAIDTDGVVPAVRDEQMPLPESSRRLIRRLATERRERIAARRSARQT